MTVQKSLGQKALHLLNKLWSVAQLPNFHSLAHKSAFSLWKTKNKAYHPPHGHSLWKLNSNSQPTYLKKTFGTQTLTPPTSQDKLQVLPINHQSSNMTLVMVN